MNIRLKKTVFSLVTIVALIFSLSIGLRFYENRQNQMGRFADDAKKYSQLGGDFQLNGRNGAVHLSDLTKKGVVILHFGFSRCHYICPTTLATMASALDQLSPEQRKKIIPVMITTDPEYDTIEILDQFARGFIPDIVVLRGSWEETKAVAKKYGAYFDKVPLADSQPNYTIDHTTNLYVISSDGIKTLIDYDLAADKMAEIFKIFAQQT